MYICYIPLQNIAWPLTIIKLTLLYRTEQQRVQVEGHLTENGGNKYHTFVDQCRLTFHGLSLQCVDGRTVLAVWEPIQPQDGFSARLTIRHSALASVTELLTALSLNRMAQALNWNQ